MAQGFRFSRLVQCGRRLASASHEKILEPGHSWSWRCVNVRHSSGSSGRGNGNGSGRGNGNGKKKLLVPRLLELHVESNSDLGGLGFEYVGTSKRLEEYVHSNLAKSAAPDWLPFLPGMSYWVPPMPSLKFEEYSEVEVAITARNTMTEEEFLSFTTARRGWPSSDYYLQGTCQTNYSSNLFYFCVFAMSFFAYIYIYEFKKNRLWFQNAYNCNLIKENGTTSNTSFLFEV